MPQAAQSNSGQPHHVQRILRNRTVAKESRSSVIQSIRSCPVERLGALLESAHDTLHRFVEDDADDPLQDRVPEFEIDEEMHLAAARYILETPSWISCS